LQTSVLAISDGAEDPDAHIPHIDAWDEGRFALVEQKNVGVLGTFKVGMEIAVEDIVIFTHNDLLIHELGWDERIQKEFDEHPKLGMAGFVGGQGVGDNGGRIATVSNMVGKEWGACECHEVIGAHHGTIMKGFMYGATLDGCCTIFRREAFDDIVENTDAFAPRRPLNHWYDRNIPLHMITRGWQVGIIGIEFDHFSANTGAGTESYLASVKKWGEEQGIAVDPTQPDHSSYLVGEKQFFAEWSDKLPCIADTNGNYSWKVSI
jgi:glycosyltransferase involved in cell wall biosynthesis